jgi:replicative DNA helicase
MNMKVPPQNLEAEEAVIGSILIDPEIVGDIMEIITHDDFYLDFHRSVFEAMEELYDLSEPIDILSVCEKLRSKGILDKLGGELKIAQLADAVPTSAHALHYAKIVKEKSILRKLINAGTRIVESAYSENDLDTILDEAERTIFSISEDQITKSYSAMESIMHGVFEDIEKLKKRGESPEGRILVTGNPTGYRILDNLTMGFQPSDLIIVAARPSMGKTAFALSVARNMALKFDKTIGIFSLEMSKEQLALRLLSAEAFVELSKIRSGYLNDQEWQRLTHAASKFYKSKIIVDDEPSLDPRTLRTKARRMKKEYGLDVIVIDYLQLMHNSRRNENRQQEISEISRSLKLLARELNVSVIAVSQLSRAVEQREDRRPRLSDLRESGAIEQDADVVLFIYREEYYNKKKSDDGEEAQISKEPHVAEIIIGKQRNGPIGTVELIFNPKFVSFYEKDQFHTLPDSN